MLVLLKVLSRSKEPMYGYQIAKLLEDNGPDLPLMKQGTLYPVLRSLEENGLLSSIVEPSVSGPPRRYYKITEAGTYTEPAHSPVIETNPSCDPLRHRT